MTFVLEHADDSLPEWQAVKLTFFAFLCTLFDEKKSFKILCLISSLVKKKIRKWNEEATCMVELACDQAIVFFFSFQLQLYVLKIVLQ